MLIRILIAISYVIILSGMVSTGFGQNIETYYLENNPDFENTIDTNTAHVLSKYEGSYPKETKTFWLQKKEHLLKDINHNIFIKDTILQQKLESILQHVLISQDSLPNDFIQPQILVNTSFSPNAACLGNGIFIINLGLFDYITTEDELAFIMCHELAHQLLYHNEAELEAYLNKVNNKNTRKKIRKSKKSIDGTLRVFSNMTYGLRKKSRTLEIEADLLALALLSNTKYNTTASIDALKSLNEVKDEKIYLEDLFSTKEYPFKLTWKPKRNSSLFAVNATTNDFALNEDLAKTHPNLKERISALDQQIKKTDKHSENIALKEVSKRIFSHKINISYHHKRLDKLTYLIALGEKDPSSKISFELMFPIEILHSLYQLRANRVYYDYVPSMNKSRDSENMLKVKSFLENIELKEIKQLGNALVFQNESMLSQQFKEMLSYQFFKNINTK